MPIKTEVTTIVPDELDYPKLMSTTAGLVILFTASEMGTVLVPKGNHPMGHRSLHWYMGDFTDFKGTITLQNKIKPTRWYCDVCELWYSPDCSCDHSEEDKE